MYTKIYKYSKNLINDICRDFGGFIPISVVTQYHKNKSNEYYSNVIMTYDTETSTVFKYSNGIWDRYHYCFDEKNYNEKPNFYTVNYNELECHTLVYLWSFAIYTPLWSIAVYGRENEEFKHFLLSLKKQIEEQERKDIILTVYVHNLSFDFTNSLSNIFEFKKVFARKPHKPIYCETKENILFKCSFFLENSSLKNLTKENHFFKKMIDFDDYLTVRTPQTKLSKTLIKYSVLDVLSQAESLQKELDFYKNIYKIPLTSTGKLRLEVKEWNENNTTATTRDSHAIPDSKQYEKMLDCFEGGDTHANCLYVDEELYDIDSFDRRSSYPAVMVTKKFPCEKFSTEIPRHWRKYYKSDKYCFIGKFVFFDIHYKKKLMPYIKSSKCSLLKKCRYDNGRVWKSKYLEMYLTDIDLELIMKTYSYKYMICLDLLIAQKDFLTDIEREFILKNYELKTTLKNVAGEEENYKRKKNNINSEFGRNVQHIIENVIEYVNGEWVETEPTIEEIGNKLQKMRTKKQYTMYARGIFITAYARQELYKGIECFGENIVYDDTDSCKGFLTAEIKQKFDTLNAQIIAELKQVLPEKLLKMAMPLDKQGNLQIIGTWDWETEKHKYDRFKTFGSKKYVVKSNNKTECTISGLSKEAGRYYNFDDITMKTLFTSDKSGRTVAKYQAEQPIANIGGYISDQKISLSIIPSTYKLSMTDEYIFQILSVKGE
jgi:hypothetical protein